MPNQQTIQIGVRMYGYSDSNQSDDQDNIKNTADYLFMLGSKPISWRSKKQKIVVLSSCEAGYVTTTYAICQALWLDMLLEN